VIQYEVKTLADSSCLQLVETTVRGQDTFLVSMATTQKVPLDFLQSENMVRNQESLPP
jgi:hypothetical protein